MQSKRNKIYVAFPGMGKTTYASRHANYLDLDFGNFRSALQVSKEKENSLLVPFSRLLKYYFKDGYNVMTNEPKLIPLMKQFAEGKIVMVLPQSKEDLVQRVAARESARHVNATFPRELAKNIDDWVKGWVKLAKQYNIPIYYEQYFSRR